MDQNDIDRLAEAFTDELALGLLPHEFADVARTNSQQDETNAYILKQQEMAEKHGLRGDPEGVKQARAPSDLSCASHDYCDANMVMLAAFEKVFGRKPDYLLLPPEALMRKDAANTPDMNLWNEAWTKARASWPQVAVKVVADDIRATIGTYMAVVGPDWAAMEMTNALAGMTDQHVIDLRAKLQVDAEDED